MQKIPCFKPSIHGLILIGGQSSRMGSPKHLLVYHQKPHVQYLYDLMQPYCKSVWISGRADQRDSFGADMSFLPDKWTNIGAMSGVHAAFQHAPDAAWLVVACDFPNLNQDVLDFLIAHRDPSKMATAFEHQGIIEPLLTIYEPRFRAALQDALDKHHHSLRKLLENNEICCNNPLHSDWLLNINTSEDFQKRAMEK